ncbi:LysR family transcriptional regulator [Gordonia sp. X0973]|uniref:LysR family transcriptional regulator n=1 Tax=Gordonia sp. X0973 TaxID=2742602 RepID=UPI000F53C6E1|nr:LysR family transcriptional regulator [Gordonia sp. X0973]QKT08251.1 LysR family transcriptional regulator [Gordonia sp. X0973]
MDLRQMEIFAVVAEEGSLHAAARRLYLSQPAVSQAMRRLERSVGAVLLVRSPRGVELSSAGVTFLAHVRQILHSVSDALDDVRNTGRRRRLAIGVLSGHLGAGELTPLIIGGYRRANPDVEVSMVDLSFADQFDAVMDGRVDVAIVRSPDVVGGMNYTPLFAEPRMLAFGADAPVPEGDGSDAVDAALDLPVLDLTNAPPEWSSYWGLDAQRRPDERVGSNAVNISELQSSLADSGSALSVAASGWRLAIDNPLLRALPLNDFPPNECDVMYPADAGSLAIGFAEVARRVVEENIGLVEGAQLVA